MSNPQFSGKGESELVAGTLRGYRSWNVDLDGRLWSIGCGMPWDARVMRARCRKPGTHTHPYTDQVNLIVPGSLVVNTITNTRERRCSNYDCPDIPQHPVPDRDCTCGVYGWYVPVWTAIEHRGNVMGVIECEGRVVLGTSGFRAEKATIVAVAPHPTVMFFRTHYQLMGVGDATPVLPLIEQRYPGVTTYANAFSMLSDLQPDLDTVRNLGVEPETTPDAHLFSSLFDHGVRRAEKRVIQRLAIAGDPSCASLYEEVDDTEVERYRMELEELRRSIRGQLRWWGHGGGPW